jgi:hypothetical protein
MRCAPLLLLLPAICQAQTPPKVAVDSSQHDFGQLGPGAIVSHRFQVSNKGGAPLRLLRVDTSCGCTSSLLGKDLLAPGESTELEVNFNTAGLQGPVQRTVTLVTDDPRSPSLLLGIQAEILGAIQVDSPISYFRDLHGNGRAKGRVRLTSTTGQPIQVLGVKLSKAPWLGVATREADNEVWVELDLLAKRLPPAPMTGTDSIDLEVANPQPQVVHLEVRWEKRPPVSASPERVSWADAGGKALAATVVLEHREHKPFRILATRASHEFLHATAGKAAGPRQSVQITLDPFVQPGTFDEKIYLTLDTPGHPEFELRVVAALR